MTYCFDSSACLRFLDRDEGYGRVADIIRPCASGDGKLSLSAIQWGEIAAVTGRRNTPQAVAYALSSLLELGFAAEPVTPQDAVSAARIQNELKLASADAFLVVLAQHQDQSILVTADFDFKAAEHLVKVEFLPVKSTLPGPQP